MDYARTMFSRAMRRAKSSLIQLTPYLPDGLARRLLPPTRIWTLKDQRQVARLPEVEDVSRVRLLVGGTNTVGQAKRWADAADALAGVTAVSLGIQRDPNPRFPADANPSLAAARHSPSWSRAQAAEILGHSTHVLIESGLPLMGVDYGRDLETEVEAMRDAGIVPGVVLHGSDIRKPSMHRSFFPESPFKDELGGLTQSFEKQTEALSKKLDDLELAEFVSTPDLLAYRPNATWLPTLHDASLTEQVLSEDAEAYRRRHHSCGTQSAHMTGAAAQESEGQPQEPPLVVHIPSLGALKGTEIIRAKMGKLQDEGILRYRELGGLTPVEVAREFADADIVIDQVGMDVYGVTSVEAMALGKPVVAQVGKFAREKILQLTGWDLPVVEAEPGSVMEVVRSLAKDPELRKEIEQKGRAYVDKVHSADNVGRILNESFLHA